MQLVEIGDMLMREGSFLQGSEASSTITEKMTDVLQRLSIELSALKLNMRRCARHTKITDFFF